jgi:Zn-dependent protease with chaperone function
MGVDARFVTWCASCEWNADPEPETPPKFIARLMARQQDRLARRLYADVVAQHRTERGGVVVASAAWFLAGLVHLLTLVVLAGGVFLLLSDLVWPVRFVLAAFLFGLAAVSQPINRNRKRRTTPQLDPASAPVLFGLIDEVAAAVGAPSVGAVVVSPEFNASHFKFDRRRHAIGLGLTLWTVLEPAERVALLGHELGHRTNGDLRSKVVFSAALFSLHRWHLVLLPSRSPSRTGRRARSSMDGVAMLIEQLILPLILIPASVLVGLIGSLLSLLAQRQGQRCEYYADELAARAAGSAAAAALTDKLLIGDACWRVVVRTLKFGKGADPWQAVTEFAASMPEKEWERRRLVGRRKLNRIDTSHPPSIFRSDLLRARRPVTAAVTLSDDRSAAIDAELAAVRPAVLAQLKG